MPNNIMKFLSIIIGLCFIQLGYALNIGGYEISDSEIRESEDGLQTWKDFAQEAKLRPNSNLISKLGLGLRKTTLTSIYIVGDRLGTRKIIQEALLAIPGHAEYYSNRVNKARAEIDQALKDGNKYPPYNYLLDEQRDGFATLSQLPSAETVKVLGEFLSDERGRFVAPPNLPESELNSLRRDWMESPNSLNAARALNDLPLRSRPYPKKQFTHDDDIRPWQLWYQQVKEGRRTFSFEGDPQEYDLTGPVREARNPDIARATKGPGASAVKNTMAQKEPSPSAALWIGGLVVGLFGVGGYLYLQKKRTI
jgi:hypothetical protein